MKSYKMQNVIISSRVMISPDVQEQEVKIKKGLGFTNKK